MCVFVCVRMCILGKQNCPVMGVEKILLVPVTQRVIVSVGSGLSSASVSALSMSKTLIPFSSSRLLFSFLQNTTLQWMFMAE